MIWKQRAKLVMHTARWVLKYPVYGIMILRLGIYASRPNVSKLCSFIGSTNPSILISVILENKLLASISCFQKICLLSMNDLCLLMTITCRPSRSFFLFSFCFIFFLCTFAKKKLYIHRYLWEKLSSLYTYVPIHEKNFFLYIHTHWKTLSLYTDMVYIKSLFLFKNFFSPFQYTLIVSYKIFLYIHSLLIYKNFFSHCSYTKTLFTHCLYTKNSFHTLFIYKKNFSHIVYIQKSFHTLFIYKKTFLFFIYRYDILFTTPLSFSILGVITTFVRFILGWHS